MDQNALRSWHATMYKFVTFMVICGLSMQQCAMYNAAIQKTTFFELGVYLNILFPKLKLEFNMFILFNYYPVFFLFCLCDSSQRFQFDPCCILAELFLEIHGVTADHDTVGGFEVNDITNPVPGSVKQILPVSSHIYINKNGVYNPTL